MRRKLPVAFTLLELLVVISLLAVAVAVLLPFLSHARQRAISQQMEPKDQQAANAVLSNAIMRNNASGASAATAPSALAQVRSFDADVVLTPRLSVGTTDPESIYEAKFTANVEAAQPDQNSGDCEILLPLPPEIISLADLRITVDGEPARNISIRDGKLVWRGTIAHQPAQMTFNYTAVGKGIYALDIPPGGLLEKFKVSLTANGSDVRMLELSLQPTRFGRAAGATTYQWDYRQLMFGRPIQLDVLGIAPIDRLGELTWLGPTSVVLFGLVIGLSASAFPAARFDRWMLLLVVGTFTGAYPLMYFAQEFVSLPVAMLASGGLVMLVIGWRVWMATNWKLALIGTLLPGALIMTITLVAAVQINLQGLLLTASTIGFFVFAMMIAPRLRGTRLVGGHAAPAPLPA